MRCTVCDKDKEINQFQTYWHSTQNKMRRRKQCTECYYNNRLKRKNPDKYYSNNPNYHKCNTCAEWKVIDDFYQKLTGKIYSNRCRVCTKILDDKERDERLLDTCGGDRIPMKPNVYANKIQKECTFDMMKLLGYTFDEATGVWVKPGYKEIKDGKIIFPTLNLIRGGRRKTSPTKLHRMITLREEGLSYEKIGEILGMSDTTVYKQIRKWKSQLK